MKARERMGTSVRTMVKLKVTTKAWERGGRREVTDRVGTVTRMGIIGRMW